MNINNQFKPFITSWKIKSPGECVEIPANDGEFKYSYTIDWGDGSEDIKVYTEDAYHIYDKPGIYKVKIYGIFPHIYFYNSPQYMKDKILSVDQWGDQMWKSMRESFYSCKNIKILAKDSPKLNDVKNMSGMFYKATSFNQDLSSWDVSSVIDMSYMFSGATSFNKPLGSWDVSSVTYIYYMFYKAKSFNQPIGSWDVSSVTDMHGMFDTAYSFNQEISYWDVSSVKDVSYMFNNTTSFNQDIHSWDVSSVTDMSYMFYNSSSFNQPIGSWNVSLVTTMNSMFAYAESFNQDISSWDVSSVKNMRGMFSHSKSFDQDISFLLNFIKKTNENKRIELYYIILNSNLGIKNYKKIFQHIENYILGKPNIILKTVRP